MTPGDGVLSKPSGTFLTSFLRAALLLERARGL
jgi:hypothetical protein